MCFDFTINSYLLDHFRLNSCPLQKFRLLGIKIFVKDIGMKRKNLNQSNSLTLSDPQKHSSQLYAMRKSKMLNMLIQKKLAKRIWQNITEIQKKNCEICNHTCKWTYDENHLTF